jgi:hypothetical protein
MLLLLESCWLEVHIVVLFASFHNWYFQRNAVFIPINDQSKSPFNCSLISLLSSSLCTAVQILKALSWQVITEFKSKGIYKVL